MGYSRLSHKRRPSHKSKEPYIPRFDHQNRRKVGYRIWRDQHGLCYWCREPVLWNAPEKSPEYATIDHLLPLSRGGRDLVSNWVVAHARCNGQRGNTLPPPVTFLVISTAT